MAGDEAANGAANGNERVRVGVPAPAHVPLSHGLSLKLLLLTVIFVLLAEVLIFLPSVANYRLNWLEQRLGTAAAVGLVLVENGTPELSRAAQDEILRTIGAKAIAVRDAGASRLLVAAETPPRVDRHVDLANTGPLAAMADALDTLLWGGKRMLRVFGAVGDSPQEFELVVSDGKLRAALLVYARNIAALATLISLFTAVLVFTAINRITIRPIRAMTRSMLDFAEAPEDAGRIVRPSGRTDEVGVAERELAGMQLRLRRMLGEQKHLADLGLAVSKINHDMRNTLASAQLISDRLRLSKDPAVQSFAPKLVRALDRAVSYSESVLAYGRAQETPPSRRRLQLRLVVDEVFGFAGLEAPQPASPGWSGEGRGIDFANEVPADFEIDADPEQLFRILSNLCRNGVQAMIGEGRESQMRRLTVAVERRGAVARILVSDTGPGLPRLARENLFSAFRGAARAGGTGLGLAIAQEFARAHGGQLELVESLGGRTVFAVSIPDRLVSLDEARTLRRPA